MFRGKNVTMLSQYNTITGIIENVQHHRRFTTLNYVFRRSNKITEGSKEVPVFRSLGQRDGTEIWLEQNFSFVYIPPYCELVT